MKLKTLKDLKDKFWDERKDRGYISEEELRAEAVKWVKYWKKIPEDDLSAELFVKYFFDITEEDLEEQKK